MGGRALAVGLLLCGAGCAAPERTLQAGDPVPREWLPVSAPAAGLAAPPAGDAGVALLWVFRTDDTFTCQAFDYVIRRLQGTHAGALPFAAVHVGTPAGEGIAEAFFRARRLRVAHRVTVAPARFRRAFVDPGLPALLVVREGRIVWSSSLPRGVATEAQVDSVVRQALGAVPARRGEAGESIHAK